MDADLRSIEIVNVGSGCPIPASEFAVPALPFADFDERVGVDFHGAQQTSSVSAGLLVASGFAEANILCSSTAESRFEIEFSVDQPTLYRASGVAGSFEGISQVSLSSGDTTIFSVNDPILGTNPVDSEGTLGPGQYVLSASAEAWNAGAWYEIELALGAAAVPAMGPLATAILILSLALAGGRRVTLVTVRAGRRRSPRQR